MRRNTFNLSSQKIHAISIYKFSNIQENTMPHFYDQILNILQEILIASTAMHRQVFKSI